MVFMRGSAGDCERIDVEKVAPSAKHRDLPELPHESASLALRPNRPQPESTPGAARNEAQQDVFLREVDDALREDQMVEVFRRYGRPIGLAVAAALLALAGYLAWDHYAKGQAGEAGEKLTLALDDLEKGKVKEAAAAAAPLVGSGDGYSAAVRVLQAGIAQGDGKADEAAKQFAAVAADASAPKPYRDLATIREVAANFEKMPPQQVIDRLKPLAVPGNPWFGSAGELVGMAYLKQGRADLAGPLFGSMAKDKSVPESLRRRAQQLAGLLGVDAVEDPDQVAPRTGAAAQ